ncbi:MAG: OmpA family protein [Gammaproteobacteria bacterium]
MARVMLHQNKIVDESRIEPNQPRSNGMNDLEQLRKLLLGSEYQDLLKLQREFSSHSHTSEKISKVISEAIAIRCKQDESVSQALVPSIEDAISISAKRHPKRLANALFPVIGPAIRESVAETVGAMMQQVNQLLENSLSARSIKWRINAFRTNRSFAEVMLSETVLYQVEQVFLIHRESSLLINHLTSADAIVKDPDMVSGMLTVVTDFVKDSFVVDKQQNVKSIKFGQLNLLFEAGPHAIIVAAVRGLIPADLQITIREQLEELHRLYGNKLEVYDGNAEQFPDTYMQLDKCLLSKKKIDHADGSNKQKLPWAAIIAVGLLILLPFAWWMFNKFEQNKWQNIVNQLQAEPGIVVLNHYKHNGEYIVDGMRDTYSVDPEEIVAAHQSFDGTVKWNMQSYYSNEDDIVRKRLLTVLNPPKGVEANFQAGQLTIKGEAEADWIAELPNKLPFIWGVGNMDTSQLREKRDLNLKIQQLVGSIEEVVIEFAPNSSELSIDELKSMHNFYQQMVSLQDIARKTGRVFKLGILGFADKSGTTSANVLISDDRARSVHEVLVSKGVSEEYLLAKGLGDYTRQSEMVGSLKCQSQRCVMFEVYLN